LKACAKKDAEGRKQPDRTPRRAWQHLVDNDDYQRRRFVDDHHQGIDVVELPERYPRHGHEGIRQRREQGARGAENHPAHVAAVTERIPNDAKEKEGRSENMRAWKNKEDYKSRPTFGGHGSNSMAEGKRVVGFVTGNEKTGSKA